MTESPNLILNHDRSLESWHIELNQGYLAVSDSPEMKFVLVRSGLGVSQRPKIQNKILSGYLRRLQQSGFTYLRPSILLRPQEFNTLEIEINGMLKEDYLPEWNHGTSMSSIFLSIYDKTFWSLSIGYGYDAHRELLESDCSRTGMFRSILTISSIDPIHLYLRHTDSKEMGKICMDEYRPEELEQYIGKGLIGYNNITASWEEK